MQMPGGINASINTQLYSKLLIRLETQLQQKPATTNTHTHTESDTETPDVQQHNLQSTQMTTGLYK